MLSHLRAASLAVVSLLVGSCTSVIEQVHPNATVSHKQYDVLAEITFKYEGRTVHTQRHFEYFLFRDHRDNRETRRHYSMQGLNIISLSESEAALLSIRPVPPPFEGELVWTAEINRAYRSVTDSAGQRRCSPSNGDPKPYVPDPVRGITDLAVKLRRLPPRLGGYPKDIGDLRITLPPRTHESCDAYMKAGAVNTTITANETK